MDKNRKKIVYFIILISLMQFSILNMDGITDINYNVSERTNSYYAEKNKVAPYLYGKRKPNLTGIAKTS